ncbi:MAG: hydroxyphenylacetyl-CoA thioesterase PaaI [Pseudomonadales bacterium]
MTTNAKTLAERCADKLWAEDTAAQGLGISVQSVAEGFAELTMTVKPNMANGHNICHGGFIFTLADTAFAYACNSQNQNAVAAGASIDYLRPGQLGDKLTATAKALNQSKRSGLYDVTVRNQNDEILAQFRGRSARTKGQLVAEELNDD